MILDGERERLPLGTLSRFSIGLTWSSIRGLDTTRSMRWWRCAVADSEERGMLTWDRETRVWRLSDAGRMAVRSVS